MRDKRESTVFSYPSTAAWERAHDGTDPASLAKEARVRAEEADVPGIGPDSWWRRKIAARLATMLRKPPESEVSKPVEARVSIRN